MLPIRFHIRVMLKGLAIIILLCILLYSFMYLWIPHESYKEVVTYA